MYQEERSDGDEVLVKNADDSTVTLETLSAPSNLCHLGKHEISLLSILRVSTWLHYNHSYLGVRAHHNCEALLDFRRNSWWNRLDVGSDRPRFPSVRTLLMFAQYRKLSDERDRLFALSGLLDLALPEVLAPDYRLSESSLMREASRHCFYGDDYIVCDVLEQIQHTDTEVTQPLSRPTWVVDWSKERSAIILSRRSNACGDQSETYKMTRDEIKACLSPPNVDDLMLKGFIVTSVSRCSTTLHDAAHFTFDSFRSCIQVAEDFVGAAMDDLADIDRIAVLAVLHAGSNSHNQPATDAYLNKGLELISHVKLHKQWSPSPEQCEYINGLKHSSRTKLMFQTQNGKLGWGPSSTTTGDVVAILAGCKYPAILRPVTQNLYMFIAVSYVHGIMFGEAYDEHIAAGGTFETIRLC